jgi:hypothetical protein
MLRFRKKISLKMLPLFLQEIFLLFYFTSEDFPAFLHNKLLYMSVFKHEKVEQATGNHHQHTYMMKENLYVMIFALQTTT